MIRSILFTAISVSLCVGAPTAGFAATKDEMKTMQMVSKCAYVVRIVEGNGIRLKHTAAEWDQVKAAFGVKVQIDPAAVDAETRAVYKRRERTLGAEQTMRSMIDLARDCDAQL